VFGVDNQTATKLGQIGQLLTSAGLSMMSCGCLVFLLLFFVIVTLAIFGGGS
jgi:hypothetical protein